MQAFPLDLETGDRVATTKKRLEALEKAVFQTAPEAQVPPPPKEESWFWKERNWLIPSLVAVAVAIISASFWLAFYVAGMEIDKHIDTKLTPALAPIKDEISVVHKDVQQLSGDIRELKGVLSALQAPKAISKYLKLPLKELQSHSQELQKIKNDLAGAPKDTPNLWPLGFQIITLLSQAEFEAEMTKIMRQREGVLDNVRSNPPGLLGPYQNTRMFLKNEVQGITFINSIVRFDLSARLSNDTFINCIFIFPEQPNPPQPLQEIARILLASNLSHVVINAS